MTRDLSGSHVVVVGGSSVIGRATAELALDYSAEASIAARDSDKLARVAAEIGGLRAVIE